VFVVALFSQESVNQVFLGLSRLSNSDNAR
jgi:hypothetical protein